jgi:hypothetical protein
MKTKRPDEDWEKMERDREYPVEITQRKEQNVDTRPAFRSNSAGLQRQLRQ